MKRLFFISVLMFAKKSSFWCYDQWDCPKHMYCHLYVKNMPGTCRHFPLIPIPVPVRVPVSLK
jgi:hypothetical protein